MSSEVEAPQPLTEPGKPTKLQELAALGRYIDPSLLPSHNELAQVVGALIYGDTLSSYVSELRSSGSSDVEISHDVSHVISPPDPSAVPPDPVDYQNLEAEVAQLRQQVAQLTQGSQPQQPQLSQSPLASEPTPEQVAAQEAQSAQIQQATEQHPTAASEPVQ